MIGTVIKTRLAGTSAGSRVYPLILPQSPTLPAITYKQVSAVRTHMMGQDSPIVRHRVQVDCWASSYAEAKVLAAEVESALRRYRGTTGGITVLDTLLENEIETYEYETDTRRVMLDYTIFAST